VSRDRDIEHAIRDGERNRDAKRLIHNWCRHASVQKFGGTGLIEMETGLPIGHHAMVCDFAPASGMATWLLEESAVRFHDANCVGCPHRVPVGLPNLAILVAQRDTDHAPDSNYAHLSCDRYSYQAGRLPDSRRRNRHRGHFMLSRAGHFMVSSTRGT